MPELRTAQDVREAPTRTIAAAGAQFAYCELGPRAGVPLVLLTPLGENLDNRGPRIVDGLAQDRRVITVDYSGVGDSTGTVRPRVGLPEPPRARGRGPGLPAPLTPLRTITHATP